MCSNPPRWVNAHAGCASRPSSLVLEEEHFLGEVPFVMGTFAIRSMGLVYLPTLAGVFLWLFFRVPAWFWMFWCFHVFFLRWANDRMAGWFFKWPAKTSKGLQLVGGSALSHTRCHLIVLLHRFFGELPPQTWFWRHHDHLSYTLPKTSRKLTWIPKISQNYGLETVTPFKTGNFWYLC